MNNSDTCENGLTAGKIWNKSPDYAVEKFIDSETIEIRSCDKISRCSEKTRKDCRVHLSGLSCWLYHNHCPCKVSLVENCFECPIYSEHTKDINKITTGVLDGNVGSLSLLLDHISPLVLRFTDKEVEEVKPITKRRKKILSRMALKIISDNDVPESITLEQYICRIYKEIVSSI